MPISIPGALAIRRRNPPSGGVLFHGANLTQTQFLDADLQGAQFGKYKPVHRVENARPGMDWQVILKESGFRLPHWRRADG